MKRRVSFVSLAPAACILALGLASGCDGAKPDKAEFAQLCSKHMGSAEKCGCYADTLQKGLTPDQFGKVMTGAHDMRDISGSDWIPATVRSDAAISEALSTATTTCFGAA